MACCGGRACSCKMEAGGGIAIVGSGTADDPFVISSDSGGAHLEDDDNTHFDVTVTGLGTTVSPWQVGVDYAATAKLDDIPDVAASAPGNGQVLAWNAGSGHWVPMNPGSAPPGSVATDDTLVGDGSAGAPLGVQTAEDRGLTTAPTGTDQGVGLRDTYINQLVRKFTNVADRAAASPSAEVLNTVTMLNTSPGTQYFWNGTAWVPMGGNGIEMWGSEVMLELSGSYTPGDPVTHIFSKVDDAVNADGEFTAIGTAQLAGFSGVLFARFQSNNQHPPFFPVAWGDVNRIRVTAYTLGADNVTLSGGTNVHGFVEAWLF